MTGTRKHPDKPAKHGDGFALEIARRLKREAPDVPEALPIFAGLAAQGCADALREEGFGGDISELLDDFVRDLARELNGPRVRDLQNKVSGDSVPRPDDLAWQFIRHAKELAVESDILLDHLRRGIIIAQAVAFCAGCMFAARLVRTHPDFGESILVAVLKQVTIGRLVEISEKAAKAGLFDR